MKVYSENFSNHLNIKQILNWGLKKQMYINMKTIIKSTILFCFISLSDLAFGVKDFDNFEKIHPLAVPSATGKYLQMGDYAQISSCTNWKNYFMFTKINTVFTFEIDPENTIFCNSGNDQVLTLEVSYSGIPFNPSTGYMLSPVTGSFTLKLVFNPISGKLETKKSTKILENFMKVTYNYVFKVDGTPYTSQCAPSVVFFVDHQSERNYKINTDFHNSFSNKEITFTTLNVEPCQNKNTLFVNDIYQNNTPGCNDPNYFMHDIPEFYELRHAQWKYVDYSTGEKELYDLVNAPYDLNNLAGQPDYAEIQTQLAQRLIEFKKE